MDVGERHYRAKALFSLSPFRPDDAFVGLIYEVKESHFGEALRALLHRRQQRNKLLRPNPPLKLLADPDSHVLWFDLEQERKRIETVILSAKPIPAAAAASINSSG